ncbi:MAG: hypothetical protein ABIN48_00715, partial [Ginsengibacter sp.]
MKKLLFFLFTITIFFTSCKKENTNPDEKITEKIKLGEAVTGKNEKVTLWSDAPLTTGFHKLYISVLDAANKIVPDASLTIQPLMDMGSMKHSSPSEQPVYNISNGIYEGAAVFTMPSGSHSWMINITVNGEITTINLDIPDAKTKLVGSYTGTDGNKYVVALIPPKKWEV